MRRYGVLAALALVLLAPPAFAQSDEIVVTAQRYEERYDDFTFPHAIVTRRADFAVAYVTVESDTRDLAQRKSELVATLTDIARRNRPDVELSVGLLEESDDDHGDTRVKPFSIKGAEEQIEGGARPDTSKVTILVKTRIAAGDELDSVQRRLDGFVRALPKPGRVTVNAGDEGLSVVAPERMRGAIVEEIAKDARALLQALGSGQALHVQGLENRVAWRRTGDLELSFYIPHRLEIVPAGK